MSPKAQSYRTLLATRQTLRGRAGLTLIEIMVVVVIVAVAASGASIGIGALTKASLRSASIKLIALSRYGYHRALTQGTTVRMTLDMNAHTVGLSEAHGQITVVRSDAPLREAAQRKADDDDDAHAPTAGVDPWEIAKARLAATTSDELAFPASPFSAIAGPSGKKIARVATQPVGDNIQIAKVIVAHEAEPRESGASDLFFFSSGLTQHAVIQLKDASDTIYSVEIHPLTGHATVHNVPFEPEVLMDDPTVRDEEASEARDP